LYAREDIGEPPVAQSSHDWHGDRMKWLGFGRLGFLFARVVSDFRIEHNS